NPQKSLGIDQVHRIPTFHLQALEDLLRQLIHPCHVGARQTSSRPVERRIDDTQRLTEFLGLQEDVVPWMREPETESGDRTLGARENPLLFTRDLLPARNECIDA